MNDYAGDGSLAYPIQRAVDLLGIPRTAAYKALASGELQTFKVGRRRLVSRRALDDFIERREAAARSPR